MFAQRAFYFSHSAVQFSPLNNVQNESPLTFSHSIPSFLSNPAVCLMFHSDDPDYVFPLPVNVLPVLFLPSPSVRCLQAVASVLAFPEGSVLEESLGVVPSVKHG